MPAGMASSWMCCTSGVVPPGRCDRSTSQRPGPGTSHVAFIAITPGKGETVRVNGKAWITTDPDLLAAFRLPKQPKAAIGIAVETTFVHCAKAFLRGGMWQPEVWAELADVPDGAEILVCQGAVP